MRRCPPLALAFLLVSGLHNPAEGQTTVAVKARAQLDNLRADVTGRRVRIEGGLVDNLGHAVAGQVIAISVGSAAPLTTRTDGQGHFKRTLRVNHTGEHQARVVFGGTALLAGTEATLPFYAGRRTVTLTLLSNPKVRAGAPSRLELRAMSGEKAAKGARIRAGLEGDGNVMRRVERDGRVALTLPPLTPGRHLVPIQVVGDDLYRALEQRFDIESVQPTPAVLKITSTAPLSSDDPLAVEVRFGPTPSAAPPARVTLSLDGEPIANQRFVEGGVAQFVIQRDALDEGEHTLQGMVAPVPAGWADALTPPVTIHVPPPPPPSVAWQGVPLGLGLLALLVLGVRWRPGKPPMAPPPPTPAVLPEMEFVAAEPAGELTLLVVDGLTADPLNATIVFGTLGQPCLWQPDAPSGVARETRRAEPLVIPRNTPWVWCAAPGYVPVVHPLPAAAGHAVIRLLPPRAHLQRRFSAVLEVAGVPPLTFGRESPRQAGNALKMRGAESETVEALVDAVERGCFGTHAPDDTVVTAVEMASRTLQAQLLESSS